MISQSIVLSYIDFSNGLPEEFCNVKNITELTILFCESIDLIPFEEMDNLHILHIEFGDMVDLQLHFFESLSTLEELYICGECVEFSNNQYKCFRPLINLRHLTFSNGLMGDIPRGIFDTLVNLEKLELYKNHITTFVPGIFDALTKLTFLDLSNNEIDTIPLGILDPLVNLKVLKMSTM